MFLPRTSSSASLASISSLRTTDSRRNPILPGGSIGWSNPTTASSSINASAHVHYSLLASQYRQQSADKGLGIAAGKWEARRELKRIADKNGEGSASSSSSASALAVPGQRRSGRRSRRGYAEERLKASEALDELIFSATDTGRLKWEAKSALLSASPDLAIKLLTRAASLGSVSACISLSALYTTGVTRGGQPVVVLVHREPHAALAWILEGCRLLKRRREKSRAASSSKRRIVGDKEALDQVVKILALLERLLRTQQAFEREGGSQDEDETQAEIVLPSIQQLQARVRAQQVGRAGSIDARLAASSLPHSPTQLWPSVLEARLWLEAELDLLSPSPTQSSSASQHTPRGPDDEVEASAPALHARSHISLIKALASSYSVSQANVVDQGSLSSLQRAWAAYRDTLRDTKKSDEASSLANELLADLQRLRDGNGVSKGDDDVRSAGRRFWSRLEATLPEAAVPTLEKRAKQHSTAGSSTSTPKKARASAATSGQATPTASPSKAGVRRRSLEELAPLEVDEAVKGQPSLLRPSSPSQTRKTASAEIVDANAHGMAPRRVPSDSSRDVLHRTISMSGAPSTTQLLAAPTRARPSRSSSQALPPSYSHHFGSTTISGASLPATNAKRPSSVVSDSPSLLFGGEDADDSGTSARMNRSPSYQAGILPAGSVDDSLFPRRNPQARPPLPGSSSRRRVTSLYGQPSSNTSAIHGQGSTATAYGHVSSTGIFDPTASLRHSQQNRRRRRADSNASASMATGAGTSIYSTQPIADADEKAYYDLPEGHAPGDIVVLGGEAQEKLRGQLGGGAGTVGRPGMRRTPSGFSIASLRSFSGGAGGTTVPAEDRSAPMLTERLERKLAESYASQRQQQNQQQRPGLAGLRGDDGQSMRSRFSSATGLASLRGAPSLLSLGLGGGKSRAPTLGFSTLASKPAALSTTVETAEPGPSASTLKAGGSGSSGNRKQQGQGSKSTGSAINTLRAFNVGITSGGSGSVATTQNGSLTFKGKKATTSSRPALAAIFGPPAPASASAAQLTTGASLPSPSSAPAAQSNTLRPIRSFQLIDPTSKAYASAPPSPRGTTSSQPGTPAMPPSALKGSSGANSTASSPTKRSPPGSVRSVRFAELPVSESSSLASHSSNGGHSAASGLDPALASAEDRSRLKTAAGCSKCGVRCINAPVDRRGRKFCSRRCRIECKEEDRRREEEDRRREEDEARERTEASAAVGAPLEGEASKKADVAFPAGAAATPVSTAAPASASASPAPSPSSATKGLSSVRAAPVPLSPRVKQASSSASSSSPPSPSRDGKAMQQEQQHPVTRSVGVAAVSGA